MASLNKIWIIILVLLVTSILSYVFYKTGQASSLAQPDVAALHADAGIAPAAGQVRGAAKEAVIPQGMIGPPLIFLVCALIASFVLAGLISINQATALGRSQVMLIGSVLSVISLAVIYASWQVFEKEPSKGHFLLAAEFIGICLLVLGVCYVPKLVQELRGIQSIFLRITVLLCFAGAAGGLAFHLVSHEGHLVIPALGVIEKQTSGPPPTQTVGAPSTSPAPKEPISREKISRPAFHIGFIGDLILGMITANALHLALASLIKYEEGSGENRRTQYFTLLALGILTGYAGNTALSAWTNNLVKKDEVKAEVKAAVAAENVQNKKSESETSATDLLLAAEITKAVAGSLTRLEWPDQAKVAQMARFRVILKESNRAHEKLSVDELIAAASDYLFSPTPDLIEARKCLAAVRKVPNIPDLQAWTAGMLRVLLATREGASSAVSKTAWYEEVKTELEQIEQALVSKEQHAARSIVAKFSLFAAILDNTTAKGPEKISPSIVPDWKKIKGGLEWSATMPSQQLKNATLLAQSVAAFLQKEPVPSIVLSEDWVPLIHFATSMRAVPKEVFGLIGSDEQKSSALAPFIQTAPSIKLDHGAQEQVPPASPTPAQRDSQPKDDSSPASPSVAPQPNVNPSPTPVQPSATPSLDSTSSDF